MTTTTLNNRLSNHEENKICLKIAEELADYLQSGEVSHQLIRETLRNCVSMYGIGYGNNYLVERVLFHIEWRLTSING